MKSSIEIIFPSIYKHHEPMEMMISLLRLSSWHMTFLAVLW